jgi:hypothetical protein
MKIDESEPSALDPRKWFVAARQKIDLYFLIFIYFFWVFEFLNENVVSLMKGVFRNWFYFLETSKWPTDFSIFEFRSLENIDISRISKKYFFFENYRYFLKLNVFWAFRNFFEKPSKFSNNFWISKFWEIYNRNKQLTKKHSIITHPNWK